MRRSRDSAFLRERDSPFSVLISTMYTIKKVDARDYRGWERACVRTIS
jgi:hypothetical protein